MLRMNVCAYLESVGAYFLCTRHDKVGKLSRKFVFFSFLFLCFTLVSVAFFNGTHRFRFSFLDGVVSVMEVFGNV